MNRYGNLAVVCGLLQILLFSNPVLSWSYEDIDEWDEEEPRCAESAQSPIDIQPASTQYVQFTDSLTFYNYDSPLNYTEYEEQNNGHTMVTSFKNNSGSAVRVSGGGLGDKIFALQQFHFHWGSKQETGSEHTIDGDHYSMEIHLVHYNTSIGNYTTASAVPRGLAVIGIFVLIGPQDNPTFEKMLTVFENIKYKDQEAPTPEKFPLRGLLPNNTQDFYRYDGSLTTPPCYQTVIWTLFRTPIYISLRQLDAFRNLHEEEPDDNEEDGITPNVTLLVDNYRTVQPLNNRPVLRTFQLGQDWFYDDTNDWPLYYPMCDGTKQSPIDINSKTAVPAVTKTSGGATPLSFSGFSSVKSITLVNTGFTVEGRLGTSSAPTLAGGVLGQGSRYVLYLVTLHFSVTSSSTSGSEHSIDGSNYPLEIQMLFYNAKYSNSSEAERHSDGLAGLAIFGMVFSKAVLPSIPLVEAVSNVKAVGSQYTMNNFTAVSLLPDDCCNTLADDSGNWKHEYYSYNGSLTTPGCDQVVTWTVLPRPVMISSAQLDILASIDLKLSSSQAVSANKSTTSTTQSPSVSAPNNNCRPPQSLNGRSVMFYSQPEDTDSTIQYFTGSTPASSSHHDTSDNTNNSASSTNTLLSYNSALIVMTAVLIFKW